MAEFTMEIAGHAARVTSLFESTPHQFSRYLTDWEPDFSVRVTPEDLRFEQAELDRELTARQALEPLKPLEEEHARLKAEAEALRPDAQAYAQFRERIGAIECEARKRADDLELDTVRQLEQTLNLFREHYEVLMTTFRPSPALRGRDKPEPWKWLCFSVKIPWTRTSTKAPEPS